MKELAAEFDGSQVSVEMRAGSTGRLYGSVTNAIIAERLSELTEKEIDRRTVELEEPIRELGTYDLTVKLHPEVEAGISVLVYPTGMTAEEFAESLLASEESEDAEEEVGDTESVEAEAAEAESEEEDQG